jgi:hypothetical protein
VQALEDRLAVRSENRQLRGDVVGLREHVQAVEAERDRFCDAHRASQSVNVSRPPRALRNSRT